MLDPTYLLHATEPAEEIAEALHQDILSRIVERIMIRFQRGDEYILTPVDKWQLETLQEAGYLLEDIQKEIAKAIPYMESEIVAAMEDAGVRTLEYDDAIYRAAGLDPVPLVQSPYLITLMQDSFERTVGEWRNFTDISRRAVHKLFVEACDTAYMQAMSGAISPSQAVREALETIVEGGVYVKYPGGRKDTIETATARAVRTGISQASGNITDARMEEMDWDIILVSSHLGARVTEKEDYTNHYWWQGKFYSKSGKDSRFPPYSLCGFGEIQGIHGANCRHSHGPGDGVHNPFQEFDSEENRKRYELEQRQRTLERRIRNTKREVMGYRTARDNATDDAQRAKLEEAYQQKAALLQRQNQAYNEFCEETGLKKQQERIRIAKWDRAEDAKARAAAKKHAVDHPDSVVPKPHMTRTKKAEQPTTIIDINKQASENLLKIYDERRKHFGLNLTPADDLRGNSMNPVTADYTGVSVETARTFSDTISSLSKKYYSGFTKIEVSDPKQVFGASHFATTIHLNSVGQKTLSLNPQKVKDYEKMVDRIKELSEKGYSVKVKPGMEGAYIATHEFGHSLMDIGSPLKNYIGMDTKLMSRARKEIVGIYDDYVKSVDKRKKLEFDLITAENIAEAEMLRKKIGAIPKKISNYSMVNPDEFMAEAFTDCMIGENPSEYSKRVLDVLDRYFKR